MQVYTFKEIFHPKKWKPVWLCLFCETQIKYMFWWISLFVCVHTIKWMVSNVVFGSHWRSFYGLYHFKLSSMFGHWVWIGETFCCWLAPLTRCDLAKEKWIFVSKQLKMWYRSTLNAVLNSINLCGTLEKKGRKKLQIMCIFTSSFNWLHSLKYEMIWKLAFCHQ